MIFLLSTKIFAQSNFLFSQRGYIENRLWIYPNSSDSSFDLSPYKNHLRWRSDFVLETQTSSSKNPISNYQLTITPNVIFGHGRDLIRDGQSLLEPTILGQIPPDFNGEVPSFEEVILECDWAIQGENEIAFLGDVLTFPRLFVDITTEKFDVRIGKQALNWGSSLFFIPTDVVFQYLFAQPWQERNGFEAIKIQSGNQKWLVTAFAAIDAPIGLEDRSLSATSTGHTETKLPWYTGFRWIQNKPRDKRAVVLGYTHEFAMVGADIKGDIGNKEIGYWLEGSWKYDLRTEQNSPQQFIQTSVGMDHSFDIAQGFRLGFQISHDGSGEEPLFYDWSSRKLIDLSISDCDVYHIRVPSSSDNTRFLLGRWYGLFLGEIRFLQDWRFQTVFFGNLVDHSWIAFPSLTYERSRLSLMIGSQSRFGKEGEFRPPLSQRNLMGVDLNMLYPTTQFLMWFRWSY